ncbi:hypothetical protein [Methyloversatilis sp. MC4-4]|uniref:hypothetical protein n=1 Tax=Methyloversatilis sp. MC4-4 TaxID=3132824 RepID=UPI003CF280AB
MNDKAAAVQIKGDTYFLTTFVGSVVAADRQQSTVVSHTTNANGYSSSTSSTHTQDRLFLVSDEGKEEVFEFTGIHVNAREGHRVRVGWMSRRSHSRGSCVFVQNLSTGEHRLIEQGIRSEVTPLASLPDWAFLAALILMGLMAVPTLGLSFVPFIWFKMKVGSRTAEAMKVLSDRVARA